MTDKDTKTNGHRTSVTSDDIEEWDKVLNKGPPNTVGVASTRRDPRPKYNIISWLLFL